MSAWDVGIHWRTSVVSVDPDFLAIDVAFIRDRVLRAFTGDVENFLIEHYIQAATAFGERLMGQHIAPKTLALTLDAFPAGAIELVDGPIRAVSSITYKDSSGTDVVHGGSPPTWMFTDGGRFRTSLIQASSAEPWPSTETRADAATVNFTVGYESADDVPADIRQAIAVTVGEFYKNPDLSNADGQTSNTLTLEHFWPRRWSNAL